MCKELYEIIGITAIMMYNISKNKEVRFVDRIYAQALSSPIGELKICEQNGRIIRLTAGDELPPDAVFASTPLLEDAKKQIYEYFRLERRVFDLPLSFEGSDFRKSVYSALLRIPYGETRTYKEIAQSIGNPLASRAVGQANNRNPIMIIIPCHRVIGSNSSLTGYAYGTDIKKYLLDHEKSNI